ncbi:MAG: hypothetical protein MUC88_23245 [Planctomycetes bacterium]|jgi:hypothetical protein|nr:hypothetical protein [Planctomycetota bacterium]
MKNTANPTVQRLYAETTHATASEALAWTARKAALGWSARVVAPRVPGGPWRAVATWSFEVAS